MLNSRSKRFFLGVFASGISRVLITIMQLLITAAVTRHLFGKDLGHWMLISQSITLLTVLDLGLGGGGLRNQLVCFKNDMEQNRFFTASFCLALWTLLPVVTILTLLGLYRGEYTIYFPLAMLVLRLPFSYYISGFFAFEQIHYKALFELLEIAIFTISVITLFFLKTSVVALYLISYGFFLAAAAVSFFSFYKIRNWKFLAISPKKSYQIVRPYLKVTLQFWLMNLFSMGLLALSPFIVGFVLGLDKAGQFCLFYRLFSILIGIHFLVLNSLWSSYSNAHVDQDFNWITRSFKKSVVFTVLVFSVSGVLLTFFHKNLFSFWTAQTISNVPLAISISVALLIYGLINTFAALLNALNIVKHQLIWTIVGAILNVILGTIFGTFWGESGVIIGFFIAMIPLFFSNIWGLRGYITCNTVKNLC